MGRFFNVRSSKRDVKRRGEGSLKGGWAWSAPSSGSEGSMSKQAIKQFRVDEDHGTPRKRAKTV